jgi:hypothetical protein
MSAHKRTLWIYLGVIVALVVVAAAAFAVASGSSKAAPRAATPQWVAGDMHNHTYLSDGSETEAAVVDHAFNSYGLDWLGTSDHGAPSLFDPLGKRMRGINGNEDPAPVSMDFWLSMRELAWPLNQQISAGYPGKILITGVEWGVPVRKGEGDAESKTAIITDMPNSLSDLIYKFDYQSLDRSRAVLGVTKDNDGPNGYVDGATWLKDNYGTTAYSVLAHPSRDLRWPIWAIRNFNNAAPTVCFGMAGVPGSQKEPFRGGYDSFFDKNGRGLDEDSPAQMKKVNWAVTNSARTYGGADPYTAKVGGVWDALLGEGRHFWIFADSDFHNTAEEFWPGQYNQDHTWVSDFTQQGIVDGLRVGKSFSAMGGLINELDFTAASGGPAAEMGGTLAVSSGSSVTITIRFKSPAANYHGDAPVVNHVDLIAGNVTGLIDPSSPEFKTNKTNSSTHVVQRFTSADWTVDGEGFNVITTTVNNVTNDMYFRLRGSNLGVGVKNQTSANGNPLIDMKMGRNTAAKAWADLWFYSNPIFVDVL